MSFQPNMSCMDVDFIRSSQVTLLFIICGKNDSVHQIQKCHFIDRMKSKVCPIAVLMIKVQIDDNYMSAWKY